MKTSLTRVAVILTVVLLVTVSCVSPAHGEQDAPPADPLGPLAARSVVLMIGDGLGFEHLRAGEAYRGGSTLAERLPHAARVRTENAGGGITDSAAAGTAIATGRKVANGVIAQARPGDGADLATVVDSYVAGGRAFGVVTTSELTHATPAAFASHTRSRNARREIAADYLHESRPELLAGGGGAGLDLDEAAAAGYEVHETLAGFRRRVDRILKPGVAVTWRRESVAGNATTSDEPAQTVRGVALRPQLLAIGTGHLPYRADTSDRTVRPALVDLVTEALELLSRDEEGFFLVVEAARIDHASHANDMDRALAETVDFLDAVHAVLDWREARPAGGDRDGVLVLVTSDHETGGLTLAGEPRVGMVPDASWSTGGHTSAAVPAFAAGPNAHRLRGEIENTDLYALMMGDVLE